MPMQHARFWTKRVVAAAFLVLALTTPTPTTRAQEFEVDLALVLAVDCSFSVDFREFALQMKGLGAAFRKPEVKRAIALGNLQRIAVSVVQWSDESNQVVAMPWTILETEEDGDLFGETLAGMPRKLAEGGTSISSALLYSAAHLSRAPRAQRLVIDVSSDGRNNVGVPVNAVRDRLVAQGITINALTILNEWPTLDVYFQNQVVGGEGHFVIPANDYQAYADAIYRKLLREITGPGFPELGENASRLTAFCGRHKRMEVSPYGNPMQSFTLSRLPEIIFGAGRIADLAGKVEGLAGKGAAVLVVADPMLTTLGITGRALESLKAAGLEAQVFDGLKGEPKAADIDAAAGIARAMKAKAIVGLGGGSALDTAKLVAACAASGLAAQSYQLCETPLPKNILPIIAVPTTAGTGSEVTRVSVFANAAKGEGLGLGRRTETPGGHPRSRTHRGRAAPHHRGHRA